MKTVHRLRFLFCFLLACGALPAQTTLLSEDFSSASFFVPPAGWTNVATALPGGIALAWDFSNQGMRNFDPPVAGKFGIIDPAWLTTSVNTESILTAPAILPSAGIAALTLEFDHQLRDLSSQAYVEVKIGPSGSWQTVASWIGVDVGWSPSNFGGVAHETLDLMPFHSPGKTLQVRFRGVFKSFSWWGVDNVNIEELQPSDLALEAILLPIADPSLCRPPQGAQNIGFQLRNVGNNVITSNFQVSYGVNGGPLTVETFSPSGGLPPGGAFSAIFSSQAVFPAGGQTTLALSLQLLGDVNPGNDTITRVYGGDGLANLRGLPFIETFDALPGTPGTVPPLGWSQDALDGSGAGADWIFQSGPTVTPFTGPIRDYSLASTPVGIHAHVDDAVGIEQAQVNLLSPCLDLRSALDPHLYFASHSFNKNVPTSVAENHLSVDVLTETATVLDVFGPYGHDTTLLSFDGTAWKLHDVDLSAFAGQIVQLRFRGRSDNGGSGHDQAIDDIRVIDLLAAPGGGGQPARPGLALFDLNDATNLAGLSPRHGVEGPFYATVSPGGPFTLSYEGEPFQPIAVLYGPLNPGSVSYPGAIGQFDIGGPGIDAVGLPLNIAAFIDAIAWANSGFAGLPYDAFYFTDPSGQLHDPRILPPFSLPSGVVLTTFQAVFGSTTGVKIANAIVVTIL